MICGGVGISPHAAGWWWMRHNVGQSRVQGAKVDEYYKLGAGRSLVQVGSILLSAERGLVDTGL